MEMKEKIIYATMGIASLAIAAILGIKLYKTSSLKVHKIDVTGNSHKQYFFIDLQLLKETLVSNLYILAT